MAAMNIGNTQNPLIFPGPILLYPLMINAIWSGLEVTSTAVTQRLRGKAGPDANWTNNLKSYLKYWLFSLT